MKPVAEMSVGEILGEYPGLARECRESTRELSELLDAAAFGTRHKERLAADARYERRWKQCEPLELRRAEMYRRLRDAGYTEAEMRTMIRMHAE